MLTKLKHFLSLIRFGHTIFALPFALLAALMAWRTSGAEASASIPPANIGNITEQFDQGRPLLHNGDLFFRVGDISVRLPWPLGMEFAWRWQELLGILLCMVSARSAAMAFNRLADHKIDAENPRTAGRHLPAGILSVAQVTAFAIACSVAFVASTLLFLPNRLPFYLSVPVLLFLLGYSYAKRFTALAHFWLGAALAMSPMCVWIALRGETIMQRPADLLPSVILGGAVLAWVAGFDIIYACQDYDYDRQAKLRSVPVRLGVKGALRLAAGCHLATIGFLALLPLVYPLFGWVFGTGVVAVAALLIYEHAIVRPDDLDRVNVAFFNVNAVISLGLLAVGTLDLVVQ